MNPTVALGIIRMLEQVAGSNIAKIMMDVFADKLGPGYSQAQMSKLDAEYVEGLARRADAQERANRP